MQATSVTRSKVHVPPLMTSGSSCPLFRMHPTVAQNAHTPVKEPRCSFTLTNSFEDVASARQDADHTLVALSALVHSELTSFEIGAYSIIRGRAVLRPPIRVYVNHLTASAQPSVRIGPFVYVGPQVVCEAAEVGQLVRMDEQCVVSAGARIPDGVWLLPGTFVPPDAVLAPYTVYRGIPACPVEKMNARAYQLLHLEFLRELRALAE